MSDHRIRFSLNGEAQEIEVPADRSALDLLRTDLGRTGTKEGCSVGVCGLCTILVDGAPLSGCLLLAVQLDRTEVRTVEGLARGDVLAPLQQAFIDEGGYQCGICTGGQLMAATALLASRPHADDAEIREGMLGNLCRCTGYYGIIRAIAACRNPPAGS